MKKRRRSALAGAAALAALLAVPIPGQAAPLVGDALGQAPSALLSSSQPPQLQSAGGLPSVIVGTGGDNLLNVTVGGSTGPATAPPSVGGGGRSGTQAS